MYMLHNIGRPSSRPEQLFLVMTEGSFGRLQWLKNSLEAASYGEVVRRAISVYRFIDPVIQDGIVARKILPADDSRELHVRVGPNTRAILTEICKVEGRSVSDVVGRALSVLATVVDQTERLVPHNLSRIVERPDKPAAFHPTPDDVGMAADTPSELVILAGA